MECYLDLRRPLDLGVVPLRIHLKPKSTPLIIGRGSKADVFLYAGEHPSFVSREHAKLELNPVTERWEVADLDSVNGMFFNSVKLNRDEKAMLANGDRVYFGNPQHSFFVEYEFVSFPAASSAEALAAASAAATAMSTATSTMIRISPRPMSSSPVHDMSDDCDGGSASDNSSCCGSSGADCSPASFDLMRTSPGLTSFATAAAMLITSSEDIPDDIWSCRIMKYLDMKELDCSAWTSRTWMRRANACLDMLDVVRWKHPWSVDRLVEVLKRKSPSHNPMQHPIRAIITEGCYKVRDDHVEQMARMCGESLTYIDFSGTPTVTPRGMRWIARLCPNVKTLIVRGCKRVGGNSWEWMDELAKNGNLEYLDLHCASANDVVVRKLARTSPNLKRIDLGVMCTEGVTDFGLYDLIERCSLLEHVDLRGCKRITNMAVTALVVKCGSNLKTLVLHSCELGDEALKSIGQYCTRLENLDVHRCTGITDEGISSLMSGEGSVNKTLRHLDLSNLSISDVALRYIKESLPTGLLSLDLRSCKSISGPGLRELVKSCSKTLLKLDLNGCSGIGPIDVLAIAKCCMGTLQELEIGAREDECAGWKRHDIIAVKNTLAPKTRVHDAFEFPPSQHHSSQTPFGAFGTVATTAAAAASQQMGASFPMTTTNVSVALATTAQLARNTTIVRSSSSGANIG